MGRMFDTLRGGHDRLDHWTDGDANTVVLATLGLAIYVAEVLNGSSPAWWLAAPFVAFLVSALKHPLWRRYRSWSVDSSRQGEP